ncbi:DUF4214 domain-containing protein [Pigmentiphaga aceris]|uniref:DUF4214 domain-containing protein n=1 Tax=Pigmentiphaga aceris TaxID=1940612 RepID=A0A5C0AS03_9BURK|nr:Calx-beta domain-containing protein [Pigmentiphaga aceris]QEI04969.1 DUF4214 domain-containing protein [Pigmentiphaga aceris]
MSYSTQTGNFQIENLGTNLFVSDVSGLTGGGTAVLLSRYANSQSYFYLEMYDSAGAQLGTQLDLNALALYEASKSNEFRVMGLSNGNVLVTYNKSDTNAANVGANNAYFFVLDQTGQKVVNDVQINTSSGSSLTRAVDPIELENGNIAFSFQRADNGSFGTRVFTPSGSAVAGESLVASVNGVTSAIAANTDGSYIVTYNYNLYGPGNAYYNPKVDYKIYSSTGVEQSSGNLYSGSQNTNGPSTEVIGLSNGTYLFNYGSYGSTNSSAKILTAAGITTSTISIAGGGVGNLVPVKNSDGTDGFITYSVVDTPPFAWGNDGQGQSQVTLNYYNNAGTLVSSTPNVASGQYFYENYDSFSYQYAFAPSFRLYAGHDQGTGLIITDSPNAISSGGTDGRYNIGAVLFDQASTPLVTLTTNNIAIAEAAGVATITATISAAAATDTIVTLSLAGTASGAGVDYTAAAPTITIQAGQLTGTTTLTAVQDTLDEFDETIIVGIQSISGGDNARADTGTVQVTITDDDAPPVMSIAPASVTEGNSGTTAMVFTVTLDAVSGKTVTVNYATSDGTATAGSDYIAKSGTLSFAPGETTKQITVLVTGDTVTESDETLTVMLAGASNASLGTASAVGTIIDDENPPPVLTTPSPIAFTDTAAADAFTAVTGNLSASDADGIASYGVSGAMSVNTVIGGTTYDLSRVGTYGTLYMASATGAYVYVPNDAAINALGAGSQSESFTVSATDGHAAPATATAPLVINVTGANDAPTALTLGNTTIAQSLGVNATVGSLGTTDAESGQSHTYSLVAGDGVNDVANASFSISGNTLRANDAASLAAGDYRIFVRTSDGQGGSFDKAFTITVVDDVPPTTTISGLQFSNDTGAGQADFITKTAAQDISATLSQPLAAGERVLGSIDGGAFWSDLTNGVFNTQVTWAGVVLSLGTSTLKLKVVDSANNDGPVAEQSYTVDTSGPGAPVVTSAALTNNALPVLAGTAEADSAITVQVGGATYLTQAAGGNWSIDLNATSPNNGTLTLDANGNNLVSVTAEDLAGNVSAAGTQTLVIDTTSPAAPILNSPSLTNAVKPVIQGSAEAGASITVLVGTATYETVATGGTWSIDLSSATPVDGTLFLDLNGDNAISATATDAVGNVSDAGTQTLTIDTTPPTTVFSQPGFSGDVGTSTTDFITNQPVQTITATLSATPSVGDKFFGSVDGLSWTDVTTSISGTTLTWTGVTLSNGTGSLRFKVTDAAGNNSNVFSQPYTLDTTDPTTIAPAVNYGLSDDTGVDATDLITQTAQQTFSGVLNAPLLSDEVVEVSVDGGTNWMLAQTNIGSSAWSADLTLLAGSNSLSVRVSDVAGNHGTVTSRTYVLDAGAPQFSAARVNGASLVLSFTDTTPLDAVNLPTSGAFAVTVGGSTVVVSNVVVNAAAKTVTLTLASAVTAGQAVTVAYTDPDAGDDINAIQDAAGNDLATLAAVLVTNDTPSVPTVPTNPPNSIDGVPVQVSTGPDGLPQTTVPVVTAGRNEDNSTANSQLADIPLVKDASGTTLLAVAVPVGTGLVASGPGTTLTGLAAQTQLDSRIGGATTDPALTAAGQSFLGSLPVGTEVLIQTITISAQASTGGPLVISVGNLGDGHRTALVIGTSALPADTLIDLENVDFAIIVGNARVTGGAGANVVYGDDSRQFIVLGEGDDVLHGGGDNDTVGSLRGNDQTFGDAGDDIVYGGTGNDILHGGAGSDRMNGGFGLDTGVQTGVLADYTVTLDGVTVVLTHKVSGEVDRFLDVEHIAFDSGTSIIVAHEANDVAALSAQFAGAQLIELSANRAVTGTAVNDEVTPTLGMGLNVDLGDGIDIVRLAGGRSDVHIDVEAGERAELTRLEDGAMLAFNQVEMLAFANGDVTVLAHNHDEVVIGRSYELLLGRNVDTDGYTFWITGTRAGVSLKDTLAEMMKAPEYTGADMTNSAFVELLYTNGFGRSADADGKAFWVGALDAGASRAQVLEGFAGSSEAATVIGSTIDITLVS